MGRSSIVSRDTNGRPTKHIKHFKACNSVVEYIIVISSQISAHFSIHFSVLIVFVYLRHANQPKTARLPIPTRSNLLVKFMGEYRYSPAWCKCRKYFRSTQWLFVFSIDGTDVHKVPPLSIDSVAQPLRRCPQSLTDLFKINIHQLNLILINTGPVFCVCTKLPATCFTNKREISFSKQ